MKFRKPRDVDVRCTRSIFLNIIMFSCSAGVVLLIEEVTEESL